jgi:hypothetical protein
MSDPLRLEPPRQHDGASGPERDAKVEQLLLLGLDHYFSAEYEHAVNVWTRVLFLDRSHARARAYIERARSAQAERQRESEELLQSGVAAFHRGESHEARRLLETAIGLGAPPDQALGVIDRLNRLEMSPRQTALTPGLGAVVLPRASGQARVSVPRQILRGSMLAVVAVVMVLGAALLSGRVDWHAWLPEDHEAGTWPAPHIASPPMPVPGRSEVAFERAQALAASGHLRDALAALDEVRPTDPLQRDADLLRADLQRQIIVLSEEASSARGAARERRP